MDVECALAHRVFQRICPQQAFVWANTPGRAGREGPLATVVRLGLVDEICVLHALSKELNVPVLARRDRSKLQGLPRQQGALGNVAARRIGTALFKGSLDHRNTPVLVVCLRNPRLGRLAILLAKHHELRARVLLCQSSDFDLLLLDDAGDKMLEGACQRLEWLSPRWTCRTISGASLLWTGVQAAAMVAAIGVAADVGYGTVLLAIAVLFPWAAVHFKIFLECFPIDHMPAPKAIAPTSERLPVYSIFIPLYHEAACVPQLMRHLQQLDWPRHLLDIKIIVEADDLLTIRAVSPFEGLQGVELVRVPHQVPKTKPKALNFALPLAEGEFLVVFDAEDKPHPGQLRAAYAAFKTGPADLACVQAPLHISNDRTSWLTALFAIEYAVHFRCILPALMHFRLPTPLGGSSNHFRISALCRCGGWDPYNVAEDADIGLRLHQQGWCSAWIGQATGEQAPTRISAWLAQRSRWVKGWAQSWIVHTRQPVRTIGLVGWRSWAAFQLVFLGGLAGMLAYPASLILPAYFAYGLASGAEFGGNGQALLLTFAVGTFATAHVAGAVNIWRMSSARSGPEIIRLICLMPIYWLLGTCAAWRGISELIIAPHHWSKTDHVPDEINDPAIKQGY